MRSTVSSSGSRYSFEHTRLRPDAITVLHKVSGVSTAHLQLHFAKSKPERTPEQLQAYKSQLLKTVPEEQRKALTDDLLAMATDLNMVCCLHAAAHSRTVLAPPTLYLIVHALSG